MKFVLEECQFCIDFKIYKQFTMFSHLWISKFGHYVYAEHILGQVSTLVNIQDKYRDPPVDSFMSRFLTKDIC